MALEDEEELLHHTVVHGAAELRVGVKHERDGPRLGLGVLVAPLEAARGTGDDDLLHGASELSGQPAVSGANPSKKVHFRPERHDTALA